MSSKVESVFTKENLDLYLKELGKEFRKINGASTPAEIILIGGASILANYGFRDSTMDVDALILASSSMKEAINRVGDRFHLPHGWLNADFARTASYSTKLQEVSVYYRTFSHVLQVRTISAEYLIAMKLCAGRKYKNDLSDIIGILYEHRETAPISLESIASAVTTLYGGWSGIPIESKAFIENVFADGDLARIYEESKASEQASRDIVSSFVKAYPDVVKESNVDDILRALKARKKD